MFQCEEKQGPPRVKTRSSVRINAVVCEVIVVIVYFKVTIVSVA